MSAKFKRGIVLKFYYPLLMFLGAFIKGKKEGFQKHIININNKLIIKEGFKTNRILLLLPHCLQVDECKIRITHNIYNCKRCGKCEIKDLIRIADEKNLNLFVATGGNIARKLVADNHPEAIVAVACERDLSSGVVDSFPTRVYGIPNERPFGPCINTTVSMERVEAGIKVFCS